ncbi:ferric reductase-like transmembrane domain-containing protein [Kribbella sp. NPDC051586]|uniref:ferric reductase-like transmembrane domain-containing protein n=1 Tax=Kribbella sp. NPDC051586 TaxID=3364118 RepID=UPI0037890066
MIESPAAVLPGRRAHTDSTVRTIAFVTLWLSLLLVTYWWVADGGVQELGGWATGLTSLGRLTGLLAAALLLAQVVLMARVPMLEAAYGQDQLARIHRLTGFTSFNLMLAHLVMITWGYAAGELGRTPAMLWDLTVDYPGMLLAVAGVPVPERADERQGSTAPDPVRVVASPAPVRVPRRRTGFAAPAVDR